jgi:hypothetical protein
MVSCHYPMVLLFTLVDQVKWSDQFLARLPTSQSTYCIYLEYHSICPIVRIGTPTPSPASQCVPPRIHGGRGHTPAGEEVWGVPIRTTGEKAGGHTRLRERGRGGCQLGRLEKKPGTLSTLWLSFERVLPVSAGGGSREGGAPGNAHARCQGREM